MTPKKKQGTGRRRLSAVELQRRQELKEENRQLILAKIIKAMAKKREEDGSSPGEAWKLTQYAEAGETSRGTLYNQFGSLDGLLTAIHEATRDSVPMVDELDPALRGEARVKAQVEMWLDWVDANRAAVEPVVCKDKMAQETKTARIVAMAALNRRVILENLGVEEPSVALLYATSVYVGAAEDAVRGYFELDRPRSELGAVLERLLRNVIEVGLDRKDVPKPLPGDRQ